MTTAEERGAQCRHLQDCPGCPRFDHSDPAPTAIKRLRDLCQRHGAPLQLVVGARRHFRHRARLSIRGRSRSPKLGVFARGTHRVVDIPHCLIHHPLINHVAAAVKACTRATQTPCYNDSAHQGQLRGVQIVVERESLTAQVVLICNDTSADSASELISALRSELGKKLHSLWWNGNPSATNRILGDHWVHVCGPEAVVENLGGARVFFPPGAFGQNNLPLFEELVTRVHTWVPDASRVLELYAGAGAIGLGLLARCRGVTFNEIGSASLLGLRRGIDALPSVDQRAQVLAGPASSAAGRIADADVLIVDPPRKGLDPEVLEAIAHKPPPRMIYVSCGLDALIRECEILADAGLSLDTAVAYDLFPFTDHIETLTLFRRTK